MAETLFNKITSTIAILSNFILLPPLSAYLLFWKIKKTPELHIMNTFHRFELPRKPLNFSLSCSDYLWCTRERNRLFGRARVNRGLLRLFWQLVEWPGGLGEIFTCGLSQP